MNDESISKQISFFCKLPETSCKIWDYHITIEKERQRQKQNQCKRENTMGNNNNNMSGPLGLAIPISIIAVQLCVEKDIICAFKRLYCKYIDPNNACFMLNISSMNRESLITLLDSKYYNNHIRKQYSSKLVATKSIKQLLTFGGNGNGNGNGNSGGTNINNDNDNSNINKSLCSEKKNDRSMIDEEYEKHNESKEWLVKQLLIEMDRVAIEISQLMHDSFTRFKYANF